MFDRGGHCIGEKTEFRECEQTDDEGSNGSLLLLLPCRLQISSQPAASWHASASSNRRCSDTCTTRAPKEICVEETLLVDLKLCCAIVSQVLWLQCAHFRWWLVAACHAVSCLMHTCSLTHLNEQAAGGTAQSSGFVCTCAEVARSILRCLNALQ